MVAVVGAVGDFVTARIGDVRYEPDQPDRDHDSRH